MSLTFVCTSSKQFVDVQHSIKRQAFKTLRRKEGKEGRLQAKCILNTRKIIFRYFVLGKSCIL